MRLGDGLRRDEGEFEDESALFMPVTCAVHAGSNAVQRRGNGNRDLFSSGQLRELGRADDVHEPPGLLANG